MGHPSVQRPSTARVALSLEQIDNEWRERVALERRAERCHAAHVRLYRGRGPTARQLGSQSVIVPPSLISVERMDIARDADPRRRLLRARELDDRLRLSSPDDLIGAVAFRVVDDRPATAPPVRSVATNPPRPVPLSPLKLTSPTSGDAMVTEKRPTSNQKAGSSAASCWSHRTVTTSSGSLQRRVQGMGAQIAAQTRTLELFQHDLAAMASLIRDLTEVVAELPAGPPQRSRSKRLGTG